jgi:outer membrane protein TolC
LRPSLDLRLALSQLATAKAGLEAQRRALDASVRQLEAVIGRYPNGSIAIGRQLADLPPPVPAGLPSELISRRPDLVAAERRLLAAGARVTEARTQLYPRFTLTASGGYGSNQLTDVLTGDFLTYNLIAGMLQPLFQGGRLRNNVKLQETFVEQQIALFQGDLLNAYFEVERALAAERILQDQLLQVGENVEQALAARDLADRRYSRGLEGIITVLDSQRTAFDAQSRMLEVKRLLLENRVDLHLALGGGFEDSAEYPSGTDGNNFIPSETPAEETEASGAE